MRLGGVRNHPRMSKGSLPEVTQGSQSCGMMQPMLLDPLIEKAAMELRRHGASAVYLFGSQGTAAARSDSDV